jgi:hypothetical protein
MCCMMEMGIDRILFGYPFAEHPPGAKWLDR